MMTVSNEEEQQTDETVAIDESASEGSPEIVAAETAAETAAERAAETASEDVQADEADVIEAAEEASVTDEAVSASDESVDESPFNIRSDNAEHAIINPLTGEIVEDASQFNFEDAHQGEAAAVQEPIQVVEENRRQERVQGLSEIFFKALDAGQDAQAAFDVIRETQLSRDSAMDESDMVFGLDAAQTAFNDALETGSSAEEAFVMAGDAASRVMASRGFDKSA